MERMIINLEHLTPRLKHLGQLDSPIILMQKSYQTWDTSTVDLGITKGIEKEDQESISKGSACNLEE